MTAILKNPVERTRFLKFAAVGVVGAIIDFGVANLLVAAFHTPLVVAGTVSFICAVMSNFVWNRFWTYPESRSKHVVGQLGQFALVNAAGLLIRIPILTLAEPILNNWLTNYSFPPRVDQLISHNITLAIAVGVVMMWNFFVNRYWTYNDIDRSN